MKHALILDLDNTIFHTASLSADLFVEIFRMIDEELGQKDQQAADKAKQELSRRPYQKIAEEFGFSDELKNKGIEILRNCSYEGHADVYPQYQEIQNLKIDKFLVTTGFTKLQTSKIKALGIEAEFKQAYVVDPDKSKETKGDVFKKIMQQNGYEANEVLVIGDDPDSEIKFAKELGIDTYLFDPEERYPQADVTYREKHYKRVAEIV